MFLSGVGFRALFSGTFFDVLCWSKGFSVPFCLCFCLICCGWASETCLKKFSHCKVLVLGWLRFFRARAELKGTSPKRIQKTHGVKINTPTKHKPQKKTDAEPKQAGKQKRKRQRQARKNKTNKNDTAKQMCGWGV